MKAYVKVEGSIAPSPGRGQTFTILVPLDTKNYAVITPQRKGNLCNEIPHLLSQPVDISGYREVEIPEDSAERINALLAAARNVHVIIDLVLETGVYGQDNTH